MQTKATPAGRNMASRCSQYCIRVADLLHSSASPVSFIHSSLVLSTAVTMPGRLPFVLLSSLLLASVSLVHCRPTVGAIRWDAWNQVSGHYDAVSYCAQIALAPQRYQYRLPFYANATSPTNVSFDGDSQAVMDQEVLYAAHAGIDYWIVDTYCTYGPNCTTNSTYCAQYALPGSTSDGYCPENPNYGLERYLASPYVDRLNFTLMLLGAPACDPDMQKQYVDRLGSPHYHTVLDGRPLVYLFQFSDGEASTCGGGWNGSRAVFDSFRQQVVAAGLPNPYMVLMDFDVGTVVSHAQTLGFDAVSTYALPGGTDDGVPMSEQIAAAQGWWKAAAATDFPFVPLAPTGWDPRPRADHPCPCVDEGPQHYEQATGEQVAELVVAALNFTCTNAAVTEAATVVVYAWNESSENGAALIPSLGNGTMYVDALANVLPMQCSNTTVVERMSVSAE